MTGKPTQSHNTANIDLLQSAIFIIPQQWVKSRSLWPKRPRAGGVVGKRAVSPSWLFGMSQGGNALISHCIFLRCENFFPDITGVEPVTQNPLKSGPVRFEARALQRGRVSVISDSTLPVPPRTKPLIYFWRCASRPSGKLRVCVSTTFYEAFLLAA